MKLHLVEHDKAGPIHSIGYVTTGVWITMDKSNRFSSYNFRLSKEYVLKLGNFDWKKLSTLLRPLLG